MKAWEEEPLLLKCPIVSVPCRTHGSVGKREGDILPKIAENCYNLSPYYMYVISPWATQKVDRLETGNDLSLLHSHQMYACYTLYSRFC